VAIARSAASPASASSGETAKLAPSPPKTKGKGFLRSAFETAATTPAPIMFTAL
jgi:hypothetical protein